MSERRSISPQTALETARKIGGAVQPYLGIAFLVLVGAIYGYILVQISTLSTAEPSEASISDQVQTARMPHIPESLITQLQELEDTNVAVKTIFNEARQNPFQ